MSTVPLDLLEDLFSGLDDLAHDLGKYICFETRFTGLDDDSPAGTEALRAALRADLLATRRRGDQQESAWQLWSRLRPAELDGDPAVAAVDDALAQLKPLSLDGPRPTLLRAAALAGQVQQATRDLRDRARQRLEAAGRLDDLW